MPEITEHLYHLSLGMMQPTITIKEIPKDEITRGYLFLQLPVAVTLTRKDGSQRQFLGNTIFVHRPQKKSWLATDSILHHRFFGGFFGITRLTSVPLILNK
ncbi:MAG: hypothetical protein NWE83_09285 [Candidatus Bathyarchaeota archaeon]|nr:hypothetical protein [Candidatus Bathyarchaeota archaeon]